MAESRSSDTPQLVQACATLPDAAHLCNVLNSAGIDADLRNECLVGAMGEIPMPETWPQVWVRSERDLARARECLRRLNAPVQSPSWSCPACDEWLEGQFTACWRCGAPRADGRGPAPA